MPKNRYNELKNLEGQEIPYMPPLSDQITGYKLVEGVCCVCSHIRLLLTREERKEMACFDCEMEGNYGEYDLTLARVIISALKGGEHEAH